MPLANDLLEQAKFLATREARRPKQASLRRAVSTAYYAVFHLLAESAANQASPTSPPELSGRIQRALEHGAMKEAAKRFETGNLPDPVRLLVTSPLPPQLVSVARSFVRLQEERHKADYDTVGRFGRARALNAVALASQVFAEWSAVRNSDDARVFMASLLFWKLWSK